MNAQLEIQLSPLELEGYFVREFKFVLRPGLEERAQLAMQRGLHIQLEGLFNPDDITFNLQSGGTQNQEDPFRFVAVVQIDSDNAPEKIVPYDFRVVLVGYFRLNVDEPVEYLKKVEMQIKINATSILYSAAREFVAGVTGRGPFPAIILPSIVVSVDPESKQKNLSTTKGKVQVGRKAGSKKTTKKGASKKRSG